ncbi:MAG: Atg14 domain-containing protein, partial [Streptosporangiales bacterium]|nr:Atg14 domain-containing protein [Streptosporangiales bacterium]
DAAKAPEGKAEGTDRAESTDVPEATDKLAEITEKADKQAERIEKLQQQIEHRDDRIEALEERLERKDDLIGYLQGELAKERGDKPREAREAEDDADVLDSKEVPDRAAEDEPEKRGRHIKMPSTEAVSVGAGLLGGGEAIGAVTHTLTTGEQGLIGAGATLGVAAFAWGKKLWKDHHSDRPED